MDTYRKSAIIVGILFIIATAFLFIAESVYGPILDAPDYLALAYPNQSVVAFGLLLEFTCVIAIPLIAVVLFPILKQYGEALALGYVVFRLFEAVLFAAMVIQNLSLIGLSQLYLGAGEEVAFYENLGGAVQAESLWAFSVYVLVFAIGGLMLYTALYRSNLVPRFISVWGLLAAAVMLVGTILTMLDLVPADSDVAQMIIVVPIALNEMVLAVWLIVKGFSPVAGDQAAARMRPA